MIYKHFPASVFIKQVEQYRKERKRQHMMEVIWTKRFEASNNSLIRKIKKLV